MSFDLVLLTHFQLSCIRHFQIFALVILLSILHPTFSTNISNVFEAFIETYGQNKTISATGLSGFVSRLRSNDSSFVYRARNRVEAMNGSCPSCSFSVGSQVVTFLICEELKLILCALVRSLFILTDFVRPFRFSLLLTINTIYSTACRTVLVLPKALGINVY